MIEEMKRNIINQHARRLKEKTNLDLNDCFNFVRGVINDFDESDQKREIPKQKDIREILFNFMKWHYDDVVCNGNEKEIIIDQYLNKTGN